MDEAADPWLIRPYDPDLDEAGVVYLWLKAFAHSSYGRARGAHVDGSDQERAYWAEHRDVVLRLLKTCPTTILCDAEQPTVIWAFACRVGSVYHYGVIKRRFKEAAKDIYAALIGDLLDPAGGPVVHSHCMQGSGLPTPSHWRLNPYAVLS